MKRREFITLLGGAAATWPLAVRAQQGERMRRIGVLLNLAENDPVGQSNLAKLQERLSQLGWRQGFNLELVPRWTAGSPALAQDFARELLRMQPDVVVANGGTATSAALKETRSVPIVFITDGDPVRMGFVASLGRPGGNATGFTGFETTIGPKRLQLLKEIASETSRVVVLNSENPQSLTLLPTIQAAAPKLGIELTIAEVHNAADVERAIETSARESNVGLMALSSGVATVHRDLIIALAAQHRLPCLYAEAVFPRAGGLISYGIDRDDLFRRAAAYADRILRGEKPEGLPVQAPTKFELVINIKTAKALGLEVPETLLLSADEVIE
jgi:putative ABC transport system substrate-binding protein